MKTGLAVYQRSSFHLVVEDRLLTYHRSSTTQCVDLMLWQHFPLSPKSAYAQVG